MRLKEFDDFSYPRRRPWLVLVVLIVAGLVLIYRSRTRDRTEPLSAEGPPTVTTPEPARPAPAVARVSPAKPVDVERLLSKARALEGRHPQDLHALAGARQEYLAVLGMTRDKSIRQKVEERLGKINVELVFTPLPMPEKTDYIVQRGDSIERIARRFGSTVSLIQKSNNIANPNLIKAGDSYRIFTGKFGISISKTRNDLVLTLNGKFFKRYRVGTGKYGKTPIGTFKIVDKIVEPVWWRPDGKEVPFGDPRNILGTRWMALRATGDTQDARGYGIHGTWDNNTIGKAASAGCIRMMNKDVEEIYALVPMSCPVVIED